MDVCASYVYLVPAEVQKRELDDGAGGRCVSTGSRTQVLLPAETLQSSLSPCLHCCAFWLRVSGRSCWTLSPGSGSPAAHERSLPSQLCPQPTPPVNGWSLVQFPG